MDNDHNHDLSVVHTAGKDGFVCFRHAVKLAMEGRHIDVSVAEDLNSEYNMGRTWCTLCETDPAKKEQA